MRLAVLLTIALPLTAAAQARPDTLDLSGRSNLMLGIGLAGQRSASALPGDASVITKGEAAALSFNHWVRPEVGITISASLLRASATAGLSSNSAQADAITPLLFGLTFSPRALALSTSIRPYASLAAGPYIYSSTGARNTTTSAYSETVFGSRFGAGANWFVARHFTLNVETMYHAVGKFERQTAVTKDPSGFGMNVGFGIGWGAK
jgi:hypothetical protein